MIIIGNKRLKETNKNYRELIAKLHKIIARKNTEIETLNFRISTLLDEIDDTIYREIVSMENDLENTYCEEEINTMCDMLELVYEKITDRLNDLFIDIERSEE